MNESDLKLEPLASLLPRMFEGLEGSKGCVYLQGDYPWHEESLGLLYFTQDVYEEHPLESEFPGFYVSSGLQFVMNRGRAEDALRNAFRQREYMGESGLSIRDAVACFNFHYKHDGYLELE